MANKRFYQEYKQLAKRANQRMRELEKRDMKSPAYESVQARLEMMGVRSQSAKGRRFSETGKATFNEMQQAMKEIKRFLGQETSKLKGFKEYREKIWQSADEKYNLEDAGVTREEYYNIFRNEQWKNLSNLFGSDEVVRIVSAVQNKQKGTDTEDRLTTDEIMDAIKGAGTRKDAMRAVGITYRDIAALDSLGEM